MPGGTLDADLRASAAAHGGRTAVAAGERSLTYAELDGLATRFAAGLRSRGVRRGDRVAVVLRNGVDAAVAIYGTVRAGAAFVPLNPGAKEQRLAGLIAHCGAVVTVREDDVATLLATPDDDVATPVIDTDLASIIYTSGSTGEPKGAVFLHRNMHFVAGSVVSYLGLRAADRILCVLPLSHTYGLYHLVMAVRTGATLFLESGMAFAGRVVERLERERITVLPGVPTVWQVLLSLRGIADRSFSSLRVLTNAGDALSVARLQELRRLFPAAQLFSMYGQTECKRVAYLPPSEVERRPGSVGVAIPGTEVWIEDEHGSVLGPGAVGELMVRGDHVMQGYWRDEARTALRLVPGRLPGDRVLRTGDLFRTDEDGFLYFVARKDDIIKSRGEKVAPKEVEEVLYRAPGVHEAAVVGVPDDRLGQAVVAHVSASDGASLDPTALRRHCALELEEFMVPRRVVVHEQLPKTHNGKLDKLALRALA